MQMQRLMARTASDGSFAIDSCPAGVYSIEGTGVDGNAVRLDSITVIDPQITTDIPARSLQSTGAVRGTVVLDNGGDPANAFILAFGSDRFVQATGDGTFFMNDLPYGNYTLKIVCVLPDCGISRTAAVTVNPGDTSTIDTITLATRDMGAPANCSLVYDSMKLSISLRWDPSAPPVSKDTTSIVTTRLKRNNIPCNRSTRSLSATDARTATPRSSAANPMCTALPR